MTVDLDEVLRRFGPAWLCEHHLSTTQSRPWRAIAACRTPALGRQRLRCDGCGAEDWRWHSCRNRHCPRCGTRRRESSRSVRAASCSRCMRCPRSKGKFLDALRRAEGLGTLARDPADAAARGQRRRQLARHDWVVYAKMPLAGPAAVLDYLSRYTNRTAIGAERVVAIRGEQVLLRVRADAQGGRRVVAVSGVTFVGRFLQHVLPSGFKRIRHYGWLAPTAKAERLAQARRLQAMPAPNARAVEDARTFMQRVAAIDIDHCPHCRAGRWRCLQVLPADRAARARLVGACRGPPSDR